MALSIACLLECNHTHAEVAVTHYLVSQSAFGAGAVQTEAETDELLLLDEEMLDADPEQLPRRLLSDFAIYNAEARLCYLAKVLVRSSLVSMWRTAHYVRKCADCKQSNRAC